MVFAFEFYTALEIVACKEIQLTELSQQFFYETTKRVFKKDTVFASFVFQKPLVTALSPQRTTVQSEGCHYGIFVK